MSIDITEPRKTIDELYAQFANEKPALYDQFVVYSETPQTVDYSDIKAHSDSEDEWVDIEIPESLPDKKGLRYRIDSIIHQISNWDWNTMQSNQNQALIEKWLENFTTEFEEYKKLEKKINFYSRSFSKLQSQVININTQWKELNESVSRLANATRDLYNTTNLDGIEYIDLPASIQPDVAKQRVPLPLYISLENYKTINDWNTSIEDQITKITHVAKGLASLETSLRGDLRLIEKHSLRHLSQIKTNIADGKNPNTTFREWWNKARRYYEDPASLSYGNNTRKVGVVASYIWKVL